MSGCVICAARRAQYARRQAPAMPRPMPLIRSRRLLTRRIGIGCALCALCRAPRTALVASRDASPLRFLALAAEAPRKLGAAPPRPVLLQCPSRSKQLSICPKIGSADWLMRESWAIAQHALKLGAFSSWRHYQVLRADFANYLGGAAVAFGPHAYSSTRCISHGMP